MGTASVTGNKQNTLEPKPQNQPGQMAIILHVVGIQVGLVCIRLAYLSYAPVQLPREEELLLGGPWNLVSAYNWDSNPRVISPVISDY